MRIQYHGSIKAAHGLGKIIGYEEHPMYVGNWYLEMDAGHRLRYTRRESFTILDDDLDNQILEMEYLFSD